MQKFLLAMFNFLLAVVVSIPTSLFGGLVTKDIWRWFVAPIFNLPDINYAQGVGLNLAVTWFSFSVIWQIIQRTTVEGEEPPQWTKTIVVACMYLFIWGVAAAWAYALHLN